MANNTKRTVSITLQALRLQYRDSEHAIITDLNMHIQQGAWTAILGKSGCGKTSLLRYLAGLLSEQIICSGKLIIDGLNTTQQSSPEKTTRLAGNIAYMAQQDLLMPWLNVIDNVCFADKFNDNVDSNANRQRAYRLLAKVGLTDHELAMPAQLSGGMRQRVALARTLMQDKPVVLMDEPFSALDAVTRYRLQALAAELLVDKTVLLITHDPQEALRLSHAVYIMQGQPASAIKLPVPNTAIPRTFDAHLALLQEQIITSLEVDYV